MVNKQDLENYKAELQITIGNKITGAIKKKLENNKDEIIQSLTLIRLGFLKVVSPDMGGGQFDPPSPPLPLSLHISRRTYLISI